MARRIITVLNPFPEPLKISIVKKPKSEYNLAFEWLANEIPPEPGKIDLELVWSPLKVEATRETLEIVDQFGNKKSVAIILKSCELKKVAPKKPGLASKPLKLRAASPPKTFIRQIVKKSHVREEYAVENIEHARDVSPVKRAQSVLSAAAKSPLRNATNLQNLIEEENVNVTPKNASALFSNIKFTPITETKPKCESKLEYLSSLPTPVALKRDDIAVSDEKKESPREIDYTQQINALIKTPLITTRERIETVQSICETPSRKPSTCNLGRFAEKIHALDDGDDDVFAATYVKGPCEEIDEIDLVIMSNTRVVTPTASKEQTFKINKSKSLIETSVENIFEQPQRALSESMKDTVKMPLAIQGSMPNLCELNEAIPIEQNRYYESNQVVINVQNCSMESMVSNADFRELEFCAASSRLNLNEIGRSPKSPPQASKIQSPVIKRVQEESPIGNKLLCFSPPRNKLSDDVRDVYRRETFTVRTKQPKSPYTFAVPQVPRNIGMRGSSAQISQSLVSLSSSTTSIASTSSMPATNGKLYNENIINSYSKKDPFSPTTTEDPFLSSSMYLDERTLDGIEKSFMKWLNALVTIPPDLESKRDEKIDVAKLFNDVQNKDLTLAPTKEIVCSQYYTCEFNY